MLSSRRSSLTPTRSLALAGLIVIGAPVRADAQTPGFAVERLSSAPAGAGWLVMDALDMNGGLGGAVSLTTGYARRPLQVIDGATRLALVSDQAFAGLSAALSYERFRVSLDLNSPLVVRGQSGSSSAPAVDLGNHPDTFGDARVGLEVRLLGGPRSPLRLGASVQLIIPSGVEDDYVTDGTYRGIGRLLFAGEWDSLSYAGHVGMQLRPRDDGGAISGGPSGNELLFGVAAGPRWAIRDRLTLTVGPELFGETALRAFFRTETTGLEALLSARLERQTNDGLQVRVKLGLGTGLLAHFGAPEWRVVAAVELLGRAEPSANPRPERPPSE